MLLHQPLDNRQTDSQASLRAVERPRSEVHYLLARVHHELGAMASYQRELDQALRLKPDLLSARIELCARLLALRAANGALQLMNDTPGSQRNTIPVIVQRNWALFAADQKAEMRQ